MENLLPELLSVILGSCAEYAPVLRATCRRWLAAVPASQGPGLYFLAEHGHEKLIRWTLDIRGRAFAISQLNEIMCGAARGGCKDLCAWAIEAGAEDFTRMLQAAVEGNQEVLCIIARMRGGSLSEQLTSATAKVDNKALVRLVERWASEEGMELLAAQYADIRAFSTGPFLSYSSDAPHLSEEQKRALDKTFLEYTNSLSPEARELERERVRARRKRQERERDALAMITK